MNRLTVLYVRCSLDRQDTDHQIKTCTTYASNNGMTVDMVIKDEGVSGFKTSYTEREGLMEVIHLASDNKIENLIIFSTDRLARDHLEGQIIISQLSQYNVKIYSVNEGYVNGTEIDSLLNSIRFFQNQIESKKTSQRVKSAKNKLAQEGKWLGNHLPIGYTVDDNNIIVVNEDERPIVLDLFQTYLNYGNAYTVRHMADKYGIKMCRAIDLVKNRIFIGYPYKAERNDIYIEALQIVPDDLFASVQEVIDERRTKGITTTDKSQCLLESVLYHCCGNKMYISKDKKIYTFYRCNKCKDTNYKKSFVQSKVDSAVDKQIATWFEHLDKEELLQRFNNNRNKDLKNLLVREKRCTDLLETKYKTLHNAENKLSEAIAKDYPLDMLKVLTDSITTLKQGIADMQMELEEIRHKIDNEQAITEKQIKVSEQLLDFKYLYSKANVLEKKTLIRAVVDRVVICDYDNIEIVYKY